MLKYSPVHWLGWTKEMIKFILETPIPDWHHRCESNFQPRGKHIKIKPCLLKRDPFSSR